jgi:hypothetical protein
MEVKEGEELGFGDPSKLVAGGIAVNMTPVAGMEAICGSVTQGKMYRKPIVNSTRQLHVPSCIRDPFVAIYRRKSSSANPNQFKTTTTSICNSNNQGSRYSATPSPTALLNYFYTYPLQSLQPPRSQPRPLCLELPKEQRGSDLIRARCTHLSLSA